MSYHWYKVHLCRSRCSQRPVVESLFKMRHLHGKAQLGKTNSLHDTCTRVHFDRLYQRKCLKTFFTTIGNMLDELSFKKANAICQTLMGKWTRLCTTILCCNLCTPYFVFELLLLSFRGVLLSMWMPLNCLIDMKTQILMEGETLRKGLQSKHIFHVP